MRALENAITDSSGSAPPDTDFQGVSETIIGDSPSALGMAADDSEKSGPPWKLIVPAALAAVALIAGIFFKADTPIDTPIGTIVLGIDEANAIGAVVTIDGQKKMTILATGEEPIEVTADGKSHELRVAKEGFETFSTEFTVGQGEQKLIPVRLVKVVSEKPEPGKSESKPDIAIARWQPGPGEDVLPGFVPRPAKLPGIGRWQLETAYPQSEIRCIAYSPDGLSIACAALDDNAVRIYDAKTLLPTQVIGMAGRLPQQFAWSSDSNWLAVAAGPEVRLWKSDGTSGHILKGHKKNVVAVAWSPDGMWLASGSQDGMIRLWNADGSPAGMLEGHTEYITSIAWSPDGQTLATVASTEPIVRLWDVDTGAAGSTIELIGQCFAVAWSPDGKWLATGGKGSLWRKDGTPGPVLLEPIAGSMVALS